MNVIQIVGIVLVVIGLVEFPLFRYLGRTRDKLARRRILLSLSSLFSVAFGIVVFLLGA